MKRRSFFKMCFVGLIGLFVKPQAKIQKRSGMKCITAFDASDHVVQIAQFQDSLIVACQNSIWQLKNEGEGVYTKRLITK